MLKPEYEARRFQFPAGATWFRLVPPLRGSSGYMLALHELGHPGGRHAKSISGVKSVFSTAYDWLNKHHPELLFCKANPEGFRLLSSPVAAYWMLVELDGKMVARILLANAYDGSRNGSEGGLGYRLLRLVQERDEALGLVSDPVDPDTGVQIGIEKTQAAGVKYPTYTLRLGRQPAPIDRFFDRMDGDELGCAVPAGRNGAGHRTRARMGVARQSRRSGSPRQNPRSYHTPLTRPREETPPRRTTDLSRGRE